MHLTAGSLTYTIGAYAIPSFAIDPFYYMQSHSSNSDIVLTDPLFGHGLAYISEKRIVADLAVEFADANKLKDSYDFIKTKNPDILEKYQSFWKYIMHSKRKLMESDRLNQKLQNSKREWRRGGAIFFHLHEKYRTGGKKPFPNLPIPFTVC